MATESKPVLSNDFSDVMTYRKKTPGTYVYESEALRGIYIPKVIIGLLSRNKEIPTQIRVTISLVNENE